MKRAKLKRRPVSDEFLRALGEAVDAHLRRRYGPMLGVVQGRYVVYKDVDLQRLA